MDNGDPQVSAFDGLFNAPRTSVRSDYLRKLENLAFAVSVFIRAGTIDDMHAAGTLEYRAVLEAFRALES